MVGDCGLEEMAGTVELMHIAQIGPSLAQVFQCVVRIQIAIGLLGRLDP